MFDDPWPEEPDDPYEHGDPEEQFGVEIPTSEDAPKELWRAFWGLVAVFNVALFGLALGAMLVAFRGDWVVGGATVLVGAVSFVYGLYRYRYYREEGFPGGEPNDGKA